MNFSKPSGGGLNSHKIFDQIISLDSLFLAWKEFRKGKRNKLDIQEFEFNLENNLFQLRHELEIKTYQHANYTPFNICDPKPRKIHKAVVKDRILHHAIFRILYPIFDKIFIYDSYSCRLGKGTHRAVDRLEKFCRKLSRNSHKNTFALKCDIKKFFGSVNQDILLKLIQKKIQDENAIWLIEKIIRSFKSGLPLGNVTSQIFANIYLNELDQFVKHDLKVKYYLRYCDDFVFLGENKKDLIRIINSVNEFLKNNLNLSLHPDKIIIKKYSQGIDFLGHVVFPYYRVLRTKTKRRILKRIKNNSQNLQSANSYLGILRHCRGYKIRKKILSLF